MVIKPDSTEIPENEFMDFPIPELDSIFPYFETSGAVSYSPSQQFYNPTDSGIFVFYTLFDKQKMDRSRYSFDGAQIGTLTTHTYRKPGYGWSETDKDQTFILLYLYGRPLKVGKSIRTGISFEELTHELGKPVYQVDSSFVFLGKNKVVGSFHFQNGRLASFLYGRYNLTNEIFKMDSLSRKNIIEGLLKREK